MRIPEDLLHRIIRDTRISGALERAAAITTESPGVSEEVAEERKQRDKAVITKVTETSDKRILEEAESKARELKDQTEKRLNEIRATGNEALKQFELFRTNLAGIDSPQAKALLEPKTYSGEKMGHGKEKSPSDVDKWKEVLVSSVGTWEELGSELVQQIDIQAKLVDKLKIPQFKLPAMFEAYFSGKLVSVIKEERENEFRKVRRAFFDSKEPLNIYQKRQLKEALRRGMRDLNESQLRATFKGLGANFDVMQKVYSRNTDFRDEVDKIICWVMMNDVEHRISTKQEVANKIPKILDELIHVIGEHNRRSGPEIRIEAKLLEEFLKAECIDAYELRKQHTEKVLAKKASEETGTKAETPAAEKPVEPKPAEKPVEPKPTEPPKTPPEAPGPTGPKASLSILRRIFAEGKYAAHFTEHIEKEFNPSLTLIAKSTNLKARKGYWEDAKKKIEKYFNQFTGINFQDYTEESGTEAGSKVETEGTRAGQMDIASVPAILENIQEILTRSSGENEELADELGPSEIAEIRGELAELVKLEAAFVRALNKMPFIIDDAGTNAASELKNSLDTFYGTIGKLLEETSSGYSTPEFHPNLRKLAAGWQEKAAKETDEKMISRKGDGERLLTLFDRDGLCHKMMALLKDFSIESIMVKESLLAAIQGATGVVYKQKDSDRMYDLSDLKLSFDEEKFQAEEEKKTAEEREKRAPIVADWVKVKNALPALLQELEETKSGIPEGYDKKDQVEKISEDIKGEDGLSLLSVINTFIIHVDGTSDIDFEEVLNKARRNLEQILKWILEASKGLGLGAKGFEKKVNVILNVVAPLFEGKTTAVTEGGEKEAKKVEGLNIFQQDVNALDLGQLPSVYREAIKVLSAQEDPQLAASVGEVLSTEGSVTGNTIQALEASTRALEALNTGIHLIEKAQILIDKDATKHEDEIRKMVEAFKGFGNIFDAAIDLAKSASEYWSKIPELKAKLGEADLGLFFENLRIKNETLLKDFQDRAELLMQSLGLRASILGLQPEESTMAPEGARLIQESKDNITDLVAKFKTGKLSSQELSDSIGVIVDVLGAIEQSLIDGTLFVPKPSPPVDKTLEMPEGEPESKIEPKEASLSFTRKTIRAFVGRTQVRFAEAIPTEVFEQVLKALDTLEKTTPDKTDVLKVVLKSLEESRKNLSKIDKEVEKKEATPSGSGLIKEVERVFKEKHYPFDQKITVANKAILDQIKKENTGKSDEELALLYGTMVANKVEEISKTLTAEIEKAKTQAKLDNETIKRALVILAEKMLTEKSLNVKQEFERMINPKTQISLVRKNRLMLVAKLQRTLKTEGVGNE